MIVKASLLIIIIQLIIIYYYDHNDYDYDWLLLIYNATELWQSEKVNLLTATNTNANKPPMIIFPAFYKIKQIV